MENFNINRVLLLIKKDVLENIKIILLGYFAVIGAVILFLIIDADKINAHLWLNFNQIYQMSLAFVAIVIAGMSFTNFRTKELSISYLTLPASNIEKTVSQIILITFGTIISYTIVFYISHFLFIAIGKAFYTIKIGNFNPFYYENIVYINKIIIAQSIFIAGASYFKKVPVFKTGVVLFGLWILIFGLFAYLMHFTFENLPNNVGVIANSGISNTHLNIGAKNIIETSNLLSGQILEIFLTYFLAPIFWIITYFNVKEKEI